MPDAEGLEGGRLVTQQSSVLHFPAISQWVADCREIKSRLDETEATQQAAVKLERVSREQAQAARIELGTYLLRVRAAYPKRGTREHGWKQFLEAIEVDDSTACRCMSLAGGVKLTSEREMQQVQELPDASPPQTDADVPPDALELAALTFDQPLDTPAPRSIEARTVEAIASWIETVHGYDDIARELRAGKWKAYS